MQEAILYPLHRHRILWKPCMMSRHGKKTDIHFFQLDKQYLKEVTGIFCDGDIQTLFEKNAEKRQALAEALRKDILENGGQTVKDQPCAMLMFDYAGIPSEGYMDEWGMNVPAVQEGESVSTSVLVYPAYKRTLANFWKKQDILFLWMSCLLSILMLLLQLRSCRRR